MSVRTFTMPTSLGETLSSKPYSAGTDALSSRSDQTSSNGSQQRHSRPGSTFSAQDRLPRLPIPELSNTCNKYLEALKPLQSAREHQDTTIAVQDFLKADGQELNERLKKYATGKTSYIEQFCMLSLEARSTSTNYRRQGMIRT